MISLTDKLVSMPLFKKITSSDVKKVLSCLGAYSKNYSKNSFVFLEGDNIKQIGVLLTGRIAMIKEDVWGERSILNFIEEGELLGETFACGNNYNSTVSYQACSDSSLIMMPFQKVVLTCSNACIFHSQIVENMLLMMADKNLRFIEKLEINSKKSLREKILTFLSQQSEKAGQKTFSLSYGRLEMADYLCVDRSALTRELNRLADEGLLEFNKNSFSLSPEGALRRRNALD